MNRSTLIPIVALIITAIALIPAFGQWLSPRAPVNSLPLSDDLEGRITPRQPQDVESIRPSPIPPTDAVTVTSIPTNTPVSPTETPIRDVSIPPTSTVISIDPTTHHLGDSSVTGWDIPGSEGTTYTTRFWLEHREPTGMILTMDTFNSDMANSIWINNHYVGTVPKRQHEAWTAGTWQLDAEILISTGVLQQGENVIQVKAYNVNGYDDFQIRNIRLIVGLAKLPDDSLATEVFLDKTVYHVGNTVVNNWLVPEPESPALTKLFALNAAPDSDAILYITSYDSEYANGVMVNECYIGVLPGLGLEEWTSGAVLRIPQTCLKIGPNTLKIVSLNDGSDYDDFLLRDLAVRVTLHDK